MTYDQLLVDNDADIEDGSHDNPNFRRGTPRKGHVGLENTAEEPEVDQVDIVALSPGCDACRGRRNDEPANPGKTTLQRLLP